MMEVVEVDMDYRPRELPMNLEEERRLVELNHKPEELHQVDNRFQAMELCRRMRNY